MFASNNDRYSGYEIYTSLDGVNYTLAVDNKANTVSYGPLSSTLSTPVVARHIKISVTSVTRRSSSNPASAGVFEFTAYGTECDLEPTLYDCSQIRFGASAGIRFKASVEGYARSLADNVEYGFIVTRNDVLTANNFTASDLTFDLPATVPTVSGSSYIRTNGSVVNDKIYELTDKGRLFFTCSLYGIPMANCSTPITARPFYKITNTDGINQYFYGDTITKSVREVALAIKNNSYDSLISSQKQYIDEIIGNPVDLIMFMGQSNMAGRGITSTDCPETAPAVADGTVFEFRAVTDPTMLYSMTEPFDVNENRTTGINDGSMKTGSMVSSFINSYYAANGNVPVVGVSASQGGTTISQWQEGGLLDDAISRLNSARSYLNSNGYTIRHIYMVWCQGESDGDNQTTSQYYTEKFDSMLDSMETAGVEKCFMVRIGNCNIDGSYDRYNAMIALQDTIAQNDDRVVMVSHSLAGMREMGLMKDSFHYFQKGYNICGAEAGANAGAFVKDGAVPTFDD